LDRRKCDCIVMRWPNIRCENNQAWAKRWKPTALPNRQINPLRKRQTIKISVTLRNHDPNSKYSARNSTLSYFYPQKKNSKKLIPTTIEQSKKNCRNNSKILLKNR
jgi:hypothetical protein